MKINIQIFIIIVFFIVSSCKKEENSTIASQENHKSIHLTAEEYQSIAFDHPQILQESETAEIVKCFINNKKINKNLLSYEIKVEDHYTITADTLSPQKRNVQTKTVIPIHRFIINKKQTNDNTRDIAIVSADERYPIIIAYYTEKIDSTAIDVGNKLLIDASLELVINSIKGIEANKVRLKETTLEKISRQLSLKKEEIDFKEIKHKIAIIRPPQFKATIVTDPSVLGAPVATYGPYLSTAWSIGMPYNRTMAQSCPNNWLWDNRYAISSVAVATAQIFAAYQPPMNISGITMNWPYLTQNQEIHEDSDYFGSYIQDPLERRNMVAGLMKGIGQSCYINYTCSGSSVNFNNIRGFLGNYGIQTSDQQSLNVPTIKSSIENMKPVIMYGQTSSGQGHWWIVDGTYVTTGYSSYIFGFNFYIHANMGQGKSYLGYYLVGADQSVTFDASFAHFTTNFQMYPITTPITL